MSNKYVAIMAGGIGSRFWPYSRIDKPKQFLDILGTGKSLLQETYYRFLKLVPKENIYIVTGKQYNSLVKEQLPDCNIDNIVLEPSRKNTAPCIAYISFKINQLNSESLLLCAPSDHLIINENEFIEDCERGFEFAKHLKSLVTFGITPTFPHTGYGYIQYDVPPVSKEIFKVKVFTEKPNIEMAQAFIDSGDFLWNAGIFISKTSNIIKSFEQYLPEIFEVFDANKEQFNTQNEQVIIEKIYPQCVNISIDYGIMEKASNVYVIKTKFGWSDLGTWSSVYENLEKDYFGNAVEGDKVLIIDAKNNIVHANDKKKFIVLQGMNDYIIVDTDDVLLITKKEMEENIKDYVAEIKKKHGDKYL